MIEYQIFLCQDFWSEYQLGDINRDNIVNITDLLTVGQYVESTEGHINHGYRPPSKDIIKLCDFDKDGKITDDDFSELKKVVDGLREPETVKVWDEKIVCEIGSSSSTFAGKAIDPVFTSRIDGTHELTFSLPRYYIDENTGEKVLNELVELISNKTKIRLKRRKLGQSEWEEYFLVVNNRKDLDANDTLYYEFQCSDAFIEELAKTGYGLTFSADYDAPENELGLGTIHELAERILKDSEWTYRADLTGNLPEYSTDLEYDATQNRYDVVRIPRPTHPMKYIPALKRYCYKTKLSYSIEDAVEGEKILPVYCYEDTELFTSTSTQDFLYNANNSFVDTSGWTSFQVHPSDLGITSEPGHIITPYKYGDDYSLKVEKSDKNKPSDTYLMNEGAALAGRYIKANTPYLLKFNFGDDVFAKGKIKKVIITGTNPLTETGKKNFVGSGLSKLEYVLDFSQIDRNNPNLSANNTNEDNYYVIKSKVSISTPYIVFLVDCGGKGENDPLYIYSAQLFEVKGKNTSTAAEVDNSSTNYLEVLGQMFNGQILNEDPLLNKIELPEENTPSAYTHKRTQYLIELADDSVQHISEEELDLTAFTLEDFDGTLSELLKSTTTDENICMKVKETGQYYQCYRASASELEGENSFYKGESTKWNLAFLEKSNDKIRTLQAEKSNRFNLLQELCELFSVWPVFKMKDNNGNIMREVWFKEQHLNTNFSGFHKGINLESLERNSDSNEVVTKIFVEDQENEFATDGFVTIRTASQNPWGENYFYNFKYYVQQELLDGKLIEHDLKDPDEGLYPKVKNLNVDIRTINEKIFALVKEESDLNEQIKSLNYALTAVIETINSLNGDLANLQIPDQDKEKIRNTLKSQEKQKSIYTEKINKLTKSAEDTSTKLGAARIEVASYTGEKKALIKNFESKYAQYIKEGVWSDSSYVDNEAYYYDAQKVANTSAIPNTTWNIGVLDVSAIQDYEDFVFNIGDQTILVDNDFFGIKKNIEQNFVFEVLITAIEEHFEDNLSNRIEVRNYLTSFEDLFQRISAVTQTVELKEQIYNKADYFTKDGEVDKTILENTLLHNSLILANASDNSYTLDKNGLSLQSIINPSKQARLIAEGLFFANSRNAKTGELEWKTGITPDGINASLLTAGQVDTSLVRIFSNGQPSFSWGELGINAYTMPTKAETRRNKILCIGDSYTYNYWYRWETFTKDDEEKAAAGEKKFEGSFAYSYPDGVKDSRPKINGVTGTLNPIDYESDSEGYKQLLRGWPEYLAEKLAIDDSDIIDLGVGGTGFCPPAGGKFSALLQKYIDANPSKEELKQITHVIFGGGFNERTVPNAGSEGVDPSEITKEMAVCRDKLKALFSDLELPKVYVVAMGTSATYKSKNDDLEKNVYTTYKDFCTPARSGWEFVDIHKDWSGISWGEDETVKEPPYKSHFICSDGVHPKAEGLSKIASLIADKCFTSASLVSNQGAFIRLDSFGLYQINKDNAPHFGYADGIPWFEGLSRANALNKIITNADFHITERGFGLRVAGTEGNISLGYEDGSNGSYGLTIIDKNGNKIIRLANSGTNIIGGWNVTDHSLYSDIANESETDEDGVLLRNKFYLINKQNTDGTIVLAIGKISSKDEDFRNAQFKVTANGTLHASNAIIHGNGKFSGTITARDGHIGPFKITSRLLTEGDTSIDSVLFVTDSNYGWVQKSKDQLEAAYPGVKTRHINLQNVGIGGTAEACEDVFSYYPMGQKGSTYLKIDGSNPKYWYLDSTTNKWKEESVNETVGTQIPSKCMQEWETKCNYYDPYTKIVYYYNTEGARWVGIPLNGLTSGNLFNYLGNKKVITFSTSFMEKESIPLYYVTGSQKFSRRSVKDGAINYTLFDNFSIAQKTLGDTNTIYVSPYVNGILYYDNSAKAWKFQSADGKTAQGQTKPNYQLVSNIFKNFSGRVEAIQYVTDVSRIPEPTIMWYDNMSFANDGYWYQDPSDNYTWKLGSATEALNKVGARKYNYLYPFNSPNGTRKFFYWNETKKRWENKVRTNESTIAAILPDPGRPRVRNTKDAIFACHGLLDTYAYLSMSATGKETLEETNLTSLLVNHGNRDKYYKSPSGFYFYYRNDKDISNERERWTWASSSGADEHSFKGMLAWIDSYGKKCFEILSEDYETKYSRIIVSAGEFEKNEDASVISGGFTHLKEILSQFLVNGYARDRVYFISNKASDSVNTLYRNCSSFSLLDGTGKNNEAIANMIPIYTQKHYGSLYGVLTEGSSRYTSGISLDSTESNAVALWAGYQSKEHDTPLEEYRGTSQSDSWKDHTPFYIKMNGELHARDTYIKNTTIDGVLTVKTTSGKMAIKGRLLTEDTNNVFPSLMFYDNNQPKRGAELFMNYNPQNGTYVLYIGNFDTKTGTGKIHDLVEIDSDGTLYSDTLAFKNALDERGDKIDENINDVWKQVDKNTADIKNMSTTVGGFNGRINANAAAIDTKLAKTQFTYIYKDIKFGTIKDFIINAPEVPNGKVAFQGPFPVLLINFRGKYFPLGAVPNPAFPEGDSPVIIFGNTILQPYQWDEYNVEYSQNNLTRLEIE